MQRASRRGKPAGPPDPEWVESRPDRMAVQCPMLVQFCGFVWIGRKTGRNSGHLSKLDLGTSRAAIARAGGRSYETALWLLHGRRRHSHERSTEELAGGTKLPVELGEAGAGTGVASVDERIAERERHSAYGVGIRVGPGGAVAIARPNGNVAELRLGVLELRALLHVFLVEQLQVFGI